jgi:zinc transport system substrate-binding protein
MCRSLFASLALVLALWSSTSAAAAPSVVATIKPVHALVAGVMAGIAEPDLLIAGARSPHDAALKPSQARALDGADLVFWIGPGLETFLERPIRTLAGTAQVVSLAEAPGVGLLPAREGGAWEDAHAHGDGEHSHFNMHAWLDPVNAQAMVKAIRDALSALDPAHAEAYGRNAEALEERLADLDAELARLLGPVRGIPYVVLHDAYPNLEARYGLSPVGAIAVSPGRPPSARRIAEIRRTIMELGAACVFAEPQYSTALVETVIAGTAARMGVLDPLGADLDPGPDLYFTLMRRNAESLRRCLADGA